MSDRWAPGSVVLLRHARDAYRWAAPVRIVRDDGDFVALYLQPGSTIARMGDDQGARTRDFIHVSRVVPDTWRQNHQLSLLRAGDRHAVQLYWDEATWEFRCWYINFQEPFRRTSRGFETMDLTLDLVIAPGLDTWTWKDEDEFELGIEAGWYSRDQLRELRALGEDAIEQARRREPPFGDPWPDWRPDPAWRPASLPADWDADPPGAP